MGIMLIMVGMLLPALNDVLGSKGRKGAVNILLNTFEQARVAALEQSTDVYVGFADEKILNSSTSDTISEYPYRRFIVFRKSSPDIDGATAAPFIPLTKWLSLPKGISFKSKYNPIVNGQKTTVPGGFPSLTSSYEIPTIVFNNTGSVEGTTTANLWLFIYEGYYGGGTDVFTRRRGQSDSDSTSLYERISFSRYTGRAQLDVTFNPQS